LIMLIYAGIQSAFTRDPDLHRKMRDIQIYGSTFNTVIAVLPLPMLLVGVILPRRVRTEKFGSGRFRIKISVLVASALLLTLRAVWGTTTTWHDPVPLFKPMPWYYQKAIFYTVQLLTELIVVYMFIFVRINRIFYTPDGISRGSYVDLPKAITQSVPPTYAEHDFPTVTTLRVYSEEELFEDRATLADTLRYSSTSLLLDNSSGKWKLERRSMGDVYSPSTYQPSERASTRASTGSNFYYAPVTASAGTSRAPSIYTPSTWNKERYTKEKDRRDSGVKSGHSTPPSRWSGLGQQQHPKELEMHRYSYHRPTSEVPEIQWPLPNSAIKPTRGPIQDAETAARLHHHHGVGSGGSFQQQVEHVMRDSRHVSTTTAQATPANTTRVRPPRLRTMSPPPRIFSVPPPPIPEVHISPPERAVSQAPRLPVVRQSFEHAMFE
jgi:hypothetical protein